MGRVSAWGAANWGHILAQTCGWATGQMCKKPSMPDRRSRVVTSVIDPQECNSWDGRQGEHATRQMCIRAMVRMTW